MGEIGKINNLNPFYLITILYDALDVYNDDSVLFTDLANSDSYLDKIDLANNFQYYLNECSESEKIYTSI